MARKNLEAVQPIEISTEHGIPMVSSLQVAKHFEKRHDNVLRDIRELIENAPENWCSLNFEAINISTDLGHTFRDDPAYMMTRDGFTILAMGFVGKKALKWKIKYIEAFNALEKELLANIRTFERIRQLVIPPAELDPEIKLGKKVSLLRGQLTKWALADNIPINIAERTLCAFLELKNLDGLPEGSFNKALAFLEKQCMSFDGSGRPTTENQQTMIRYLVEACTVFRYSRGFDALAFIQKKHGVTEAELENLTEHGATKLIMALIALMTSLYSETRDRLLLNKELEELEDIEELCEKRKLQ